MKRKRTRIKIESLIAEINSMAEISLKTGRDLTEYIEQTYHKDDVYPSGEIMAWYANTYGKDHAIIDFIENGLKEVTKTN